MKRSCSPDQIFFRDDAGDHEIGTGNQVQVDLLIRKNAEDGTGDSRLSGDSLADDIEQGNTLIDDPVFASDLFHQIVQLLLVDMGVSGNNKSNVVVSGVTLCLNDEADVDSQFTERTEDVRCDSRGVRDRNQ